MTSVIRSMHFHSLDGNFKDSHKSHGDMLAHKIAEILPRRSVSKSILRTLGLEYNGERRDGGPTDGSSCSSAISCLTKSSRQLPQCVRRAYSPSNFLRSASPPPTNVVDYTTPKCVVHGAMLKVSQPASLSSSSSSSIRFSSNCDSRLYKRDYTCLENITPVLERYSLQQPTKFVAPNPTPIKPKCPETASCARENKRQRDLNTDKYKSCYLTMNNLYHQGEFDEGYFDELENHQQNLNGSTNFIEVPSWRVNDILTEFSEELGPSMSLRPRLSLTPGTASSSMPQRKIHLSNTPTSSRRQKISEANSDHEENELEVEDTSDTIYLARHAKFEVEEVRRERLSHQRAYEDELRTRLEQRDAESWGKRQVSRVDPLSCVNPEKFMPKQLAIPLHRARYIHVTNQVPVVAFGCRVPRPHFRKFSLT